MGLLRHLLVLFLSGLILQIVKIPVDQLEREIIWSVDKNNRRASTTIIAYSFHLSLNVDLLRPLLGKHIN